MLKLPPIDLEIPCGPEHVAFLNNNTPVLRLELQGSTWIPLVNEKRCLLVFLRGYTPGDTLIKVRITETAFNVAFAEPMLNA